MNSSSEAFVSNFAPISGKRETKGNETGNEQETNSGFLCKIGNEPKTRNGNEGDGFWDCSFPSPIGPGARQRQIILTIPDIANFSPPHDARALFCASCKRKVATMNLYATTHIGTLGSFSSRPGSWSSIRDLPSAVLTIAWSHEKAKGTERASASPDIAEEQGAPTPGGGREKDSRDLNERDRGNRQGVNAGQADAPSEARGKDRKMPEATVAPNVAGELGTPSEVGEQGNTARNVNKQGRGSRQSTSTGVPDAASEAKDKSRKAPQPTAAPNVAGEQRMPPATSDQEGSDRNVNKQEKSDRQEPAAVDASRDSRQPQSKTNLHHSSRQPAKQNRQPQRSAAPQQKAPSKPPNAPQGKRKGKGGGKEKPNEKKTKAATEPVG